MAGLRDGWSTYRMDLVKWALKLSLVPSSLFVGMTMLFAIPLNDAAHALEFALWASVAWSGLIWFGAALFALATEPIV